MATSLTSPALAFSTDKAIIAARKALAKVSLFATDFSNEAVQPGTTMKVPVFTPGTASAFNASSNNYEKADGTLTYADVLFDKHVKNTFAVGKIRNINRGFTVVREHSHRGCVYDYLAIIP